MVIKKRYTINCGIYDLFQALTQQDSIEKWTGSGAKIDHRPETGFSLWNGAVYGEFVVATPTHILQKWKESSWEHFSEVSMRMTDIGGNVLVDLTQTHVPVQSFNSVMHSWDDYYFHPLKNYLETIKTAKTNN